MKAGAFARISAAPYNSRAAAPGCCALLRHLDQCYLSSGLNPLGGRDGQRAVESTRRGSRGRRCLRHHGDGREPTGSLLFLRWCGVRASGASALTRTRPSQQGVFAGASRRIAQLARLPAEPLDGAAVQPAAGLMTGRYASPFTLGVQVRGAGLALITGCQCHPVDPCALDPSRELVSLCSGSWSGSQSGCPRASGSFIPCARGG